MSQSSPVLTVRVSRDLERRLTREARRTKRTRSETARAILESALSDRAEPDPAAEARRQSLLVSKSKSEKEVLEFIESVADRRGWR